MANSQDDPFAAPAPPARSRTPPLQRSFSVGGGAGRGGLAGRAPLPGGSSSSHPIAVPAAGAEAAASGVSPPLTPTPTPFSSFAGPAPAAVMSRLAGEISPPTPAPSPQPQSRVRHASQSVETAAGADSSADWPHLQKPFFDPSLAPPLSPPSASSSLLSHLRHQINSLSPASRALLLSQLITDSSPSDLSPLLQQITPRLQRDFLKTLPLELAFHVLSFVDDARTLARASGVSRFWRALLEDEATWKRMCWKSGFAPPASAIVPPASPAYSPPSTADFTPGSPFAFPSLPSAGGTTGERLRALEFLPRPSSPTDDSHLYTPAGRERRGTLDRSALSEFAARAQLFDLPPGSRAANAASAFGGEGGGAMGLGFGGTERDGEGEMERRTGGIAQRRGRAEVPQLAGLGRAGSSSAGAAAQGGGIDVSSLRHGLAASQAPLPPPVPVPSTSSVMLLPTAQQHAPHYATPQQQQQHFTSPPMFALPGSSTFSPPSHPAHLSPSAYSSSLPAIPSFPPPSRPAHSAPRPAPFSYKQHYKLAYLTQDAWLHGPGRMLSTQMSADDGVVTSLGIDGEWIVVGLASGGVHVFEAGAGTYARSLEGHELGVWCLTLVSKGGGPPAGAAASADPEEEEWDGVGKGKGRAAPAPSSSSLRVPPSSQPNFFADGATTPLAASFHSSPSSPSYAARAPRRRRSFPSASPPAPGPAPASHPSAGGDAAGGGMGLGAGGPTGDSGAQASVTGTARGWGQKGAVVVSGGCDRDVRVWDVETGRCLHLLRGHTSTVRCMRVLDGRPIAVSGSRDKTVRVWDIEQGVCLHVLNGHDLSVRCLEVHGNKVVSGSYDATCRLWDVDTGECLHVFRGHVHQIYAVAFDGIKVVTGSLDSTVRVWSAETGEFLALLQGHTSLVGQLQLDPSTNTLVTGGSDGRVLVFSLETYDAVHALFAHTNSVTCLQFDSRFLVTGSNDGKIKLWDFRTGRYIRDLAEPCDAVWRVVFRDDKCVTLCRRNNRTLMDVKTFRPAMPEDDTVAPAAAGAPAT
ncbi:hypothetical protein JCM10213_007973 [Rhodosporidiobolus nylandii]